MKRTLNTWLAYALLAIAATSCVSVGSSILSDIALHQASDCMGRADTLYLFYEGEDINFDYVPIGEVEATAARFSENTEVFNHLKYQAWNNCANGIILIKSGNKQREYGELLDEEDNEVYDAKSYTGLAVRIDVNQQFREGYGRAGVSSQLFVPEVEESFATEAKAAEDAAGATLLGVVLGVVVGVIMLAHQGGI